jgi:peptidoglycan/LPS O-acetylase OafA/YrhL
MESREPLPVLTGLRFLAAFSVMIGHGLGVFLEHAQVDFGPIDWLIQLSGLGMTLFFVLSGFVIHYNYSALVTTGGAGGIGVFLWARFARLYPLFLLMLCVNILLSRRLHDLLAGQPEGFTGLLEALPFFLLSVHSWIYIPIDGVSLISGIGGGSPITWSISTEWFFYLAYLLIAFAVLRLNRPMAMAGAMLIWCIVWAALASTIFDLSSVIDTWAVQRFGRTAAFSPDPRESFVRWLLYFSPYLRIGEFILGCLTSQLFLVLRRRKVRMREAALGIMMLALAMVSVPTIMFLMFAPDSGIVMFRKLNMNFALAPSVALIIFCSARYDSMLARLLSSPPCIFFGEASYAIYLIHDLVFFTVARLQERLMPAFAPSIPLGLAELAAVSVGVLMISRAVYSHFEWPMRRWVRGLWKIPASRPTLAT